MTIYLKRAEERIQAGYNSEYQDAVRLLIRDAKAAKRGGSSGNFKSELMRLQVVYKLKRNFLKLVERNKRALGLA